MFLSRRRSFVEEERIFDRPSSPLRRLSDESSSTNEMEEEDSFMKSSSINKSNK